MIFGLIRVMPGTPSGSAMPKAPTEWDPRSNPAHRLVQMLDILAMSFIRFRILSAQPKWHGFQKARPLYEEWLQVVRAIVDLDSDPPEYQVGVYSDPVVAQF